jgi:GLPGLI family protein
MKSIVLLISISIVTSTYCFGQNIQIVYEATPKYANEIIEAMPSMAKDKNRYRSSLAINSHNSLYKRDSLLVGNRFDHSRVEIWQKEELYKNRQNDQWLKISGAYIDGTGYEQKLSDLISNNNFEWSKTGNVKEILGFKCIEVVSKDKTAYYARDIPIPDGPKDGIFSLPGLVLEYEFGGGHWEAVDIYFPENLEIRVPKVKISSKESDIKMSVFDQKDLPASKAIRIDYTTPANKWIKFDGR